MKPIINPWMIYLAGITDSVNELLMFLSAVCILICIISFLFYIMSWDKEMTDICFNDTEMRNKRKPYSRFSMRMAFLTMVLSLSVVFIPDKQTIYQILIAENITPSNIEILGQTGADIVDYMVEKIDLLIKETEE